MYPVLFFLLDRKMKSERGAKGSRWVQERD
jgi:hypothetical protein